MTGATGKRNEDEERNSNIVSMGVIGVWPSYAQCLKGGRGGSTQLCTLTCWHTHECCHILPKSRQNLLYNMPGMLRLGSGRLNKARVWGFHTAQGQAMTERSEATHRQSGFLSSLTYICNVRGIKALLEIYSCDSWCCFCLSALCFPLRWVRWGTVMLQCTKRWSRSWRQNTCKETTKNVTIWAQSLQGKLNWIC